MDFRIRVSVSDLPCFILDDFIEFLARQYDVPMDGIREDRLSSFLLFLSFRGTFLPRYFHDFSGGLFLEACH